MLISSEHLDRFEQAVAEHRRLRGFEPDPQWKSMLFLVTATSSLWDRVKSCIKMKTGSANLDKVPRTLSSSELGLLTLAQNLFGQDKLVDVAGLCDQMDDARWTVFIKALRIYRGEDI